MKMSCGWSVGADALIGLALGAALAVPSPLHAADVAAAAAPPSIELPFPRSERAQSIWASNACWRDCGAYCAWGQTACLARDSQGQCLKLTDDCDRYCQRSCRSSGGPFLPLDF